MSRIHPASSKPFDAIIVGGGPAGSATAGLLARAGLRALLIEATHYEKPSRLETLPPAVKPRLARLGAWSRFERQRHDRIDGTIAFWGNATRAVDEYAFSCYENAWLVNRRDFDRMLAEHAADAGARVQLDTRVVGCHIAGSEWRVQVRTPAGVKTLRSWFVVDATGRTGTAGHAGSTRFVHDSIVAVTWLAPANGGSAYALLETAADGWFYSAEREDGCVAAMYVTDARRLRSSGSGITRSVSSALESAPHTSMRIRHSAREWMPRVVSAAISMRSPAAGPQWVSVGDAAASMDPLCGRGVVDALDSAFAASGAIGSSRPAAALEAYQKSVLTRWLRDLTIRREYYASERRWCRSGFWRRRVSPS
jgi:flavin-dependent dehydrogenase